LLVVGTEEKQILKEEGSNRLVPSFTNVLAALVRVLMKRFDGTFKMS